MKTTITTLVAAAAIATTMGAVSQTASADTAIAAKAPIAEVNAGAKNGGTVNVGRRFRYGFNRFTHSYRPVYVCKHHYRWVLTRVGWRQVYVGYRCGYTNNY